MIMGAKFDGPSSSDFVCILFITSTDRTTDRLHNTVDVVIFAGGNFRENVGKTFHVGVIFTILPIFPS